MNHFNSLRTPRAGHRAAPKPAGVPSEDRPMYPSDEGSSCSK